MTPLATSARIAPDALAGAATCAPRDGQPTLWGLSPAQLHNRFWAARGVQVVRLGEASEIVHNAELFLLTGPRLLTIFRLRSLLDHLSWLRPRVTWVRIRDTRQRGYRERVLVDGDDRFHGFRRDYGGADTRLARVALTTDPAIVRLWQRETDPTRAWRLLRRHVPRRQRATATLKGRAYDRDSDDEVMQFTRDLLQTWRRPDATISRAKRDTGGAWYDAQSDSVRGAKFIGAAWIGAGRTLAAQTTVVGPAILWDDPGARPEPDQVDWRELEHTDSYIRAIRPRRRTPWSLAAKRASDVVAAGLALLLVLPLFPMVMLAIWLEDGRPFFFAHRRETLGGRTFPCIKFRSMRKDAERIKAELQQANQADGPQFFIERDPRLTRVGHLIRKLQIDELPQLWNILRGDMSLVGPRPSPYEENQYCPAWREARLSVRAGLTGLWQVMRTREQGTDFQEWIRYDIEYVQNAGFWMDLWIIWKTIGVVLKGVFSK